MESVGWAILDPDAGTVTLPDFNKYTTSSSRRGAGSKSKADRQREYCWCKRKADQAAAKAYESDATRDVTSVTTSDRR